MLVRARLYPCALGIALGLGCGDGGPATSAPDAPALSNPDASLNDAPTMPPAAVLKRPSKSSTVAITEDDRFVVMVNPEDDSLSVFRTSDNSRTAKITTGDEPSAVVLAPDGRTAYVANRAEATVVKVTGIDTGSPTVAATLSTGSEPTGVALSPTGAKLFVAEYAEGSVLVVDTLAFTQAAVIKGNIGHPRALAVTNNGDAVDTDELLIVPEFFGEPNDNAKDAATLDKSRQGRVRIYDLATLSPQPALTFAARDSGVTPLGGSATAFTAPNQLYNVAIRRDREHPEDTSKARIYLPSVSASPQAPSVFNGNIHPVVYVGDLGTRTENTGPAGTVNLTERLLAHDADGVAGKWFLADIVDMAFIPAGNSDGNVAYVVSRGADVVQRVTFDDRAGVTVGGSVNLQINVIGDPRSLHDGCKAPTGIVIANDGATAYLNCWASQRLGVVALGNRQALTGTAEAFAPTPAQAGVDRGRRFFFTGRGRWSGDGKADAAPVHSDGGWSSCGSCHPDGLTDNMTWIFGTGPRQTISMDGTFAKQGVNSKQRILNSTAIFDELHDFEANTRGTSGGLGALTTGGCGVLSTETRQALAGGLAKPARELQATAGSCTTDWDDLESWVKTIRPPKALTRLDAARVAAGAQLFGPGTGVKNGNCVSCHGGSGWTISRRFWSPTSDTNVALAAAPFLPSAAPAWPSAWNQHSKQIEAEQPGGVAPPQVACVVRNLATQTAVNTFGPAALEKKPDGTVAQGAGGYNVPSLYGLALNAPYLHAGQAETLRALLDRFDGHLKAANDNFDPNSDDKDALVAFLLSIDETTEEMDVPAGADKCVSFP